MKLFAILIALLIAHQTCNSLPIGESDEDDSFNALDDSDDSSDSDDIDFDSYDRKFVREFLLDPQKPQEVVLFDNSMGMKTNNNAKTGSANIDSSDDSDADDLGNSDSESFEELDDESSSSEQDLTDVKAIEKPKVLKADVKPNVVKSEATKPEVVKSKLGLPENVKSEVVKSGSIRQGIPYSRPANRPVKPLVFNRPAINKPQQKEGTPEEFESEINALKKEIQRMKALDQSDSEEDGDEKAGSLNDEFVSQLISKIKNLRDEIKLEKGLPVESSEEIVDDEDESFEDDSDEFDDDESDEDSGSESDEEKVVEIKPAVRTESKIPAKPVVKPAPVKSVKVESSSEEQQGLRNIKLSQTFDGQDDPEEAVDDEETSDKVNELVKVIETLKEEIKEERRQEAEDSVEDKLSGEDYMDSDEILEDSDEILEDSDEIENAESSEEVIDDESGESVDENLLSIFQNLKNNEDLKDLKHVNDDKNSLLDIEKPENMNSDEVKIGFVISNEEASTEDEKIIDLLNEKPVIIVQRIADIEVVPVDLPPFEFPNNNIELIEIVEIPDQGIIKPNEVFNVPKQSDIAKKVVPESAITGGVMSKVASLFSYIKQQFT